MPKKFKTLVSWNVNGVRAAVRKGFLDWIKEVQPDILCIQETKAHVEQLDHDVLHPNGYMGIWNQAEKKGYSGVATFVKEKPLFEMNTFGEPLLDEEGRVILTEHPDFYLFNVYFPNGGRGSERLKYKMDFYKRFLKLMNVYRKKKPVIMTGDVNTAHNEIDLARPKANEKRSGFMRIERDWLDNLVANDYIDTFRHLYPDKKDVYSWWDMQTRARERNVGWRLDYVWADKAIVPSIKDAFIWSDVMGSDHAPVGIKIDTKI
jgi:exodeoxyribonuclease III